MYDRPFSRVYNERWPAYGKKVAPCILDYYEAHGTKPLDPNVLDLCCGTGAFALEALSRGYNVLGIDASQHMLEHAETNAASYVRSGKARFMRARAETFVTSKRYGLIVSVFDSLNHLPNMEALESCFGRCFEAATEDAHLVFDLNTRLGLSKWNKRSITEDENLFMLNRGLYIDGAPRALVRITGFVRNKTGLFERFDENLYNTVFELSAVADALRRTGWINARIARIDSLQAPLQNPETQDRVFFVATRSRSQAL